MPVAAEAGVRWRAFAERARCRPAPSAPPGREPPKASLIFYFLEVREASPSFTGPSPAPRYEMDEKQSDGLV